MSLNVTANIQHKHLQHKKL